ncbi:MAG: hypothetical protein Q7T37_00230 [bacterium]|nr:hypothetical protein [bacterium]MDO8742503.1 hypothetical protein [bacterium]
MLDSKGVMFFRFNGGRIGWLIADAHGVFCIWTLKLLIEACILFIVFGFTGISPYELASKVDTIAGKWLSTGWIFLLSILWPLLIAFIYVFVLRRNPTVKSAQRALPYTRYGWI